VDLQETALRKELFRRIRSYEANAARVHSSNFGGFAHLPIIVKAH
jgi:hypothetical protein